MKSIDQLRHSADLAIQHPEPTFWGTDDVDYASPAVAVRPELLIAILDVFERAEIMADDLDGHGGREMRRLIERVEGL